MAYVNHSQIKSAVNSSPIAASGPKRIQNRVYRQCAKEGFRARIRHELEGKVPTAVPLYSHHATRQSHFALGWNAVTAAHLLRARAHAKAQAAVG